MRGGTRNKYIIHVVRIIHRGYLKAISKTNSSPRERKRTILGSKKAEQINQRHCTIWRQKI